MPSMVLPTMELPAQNSMEKASTRSTLPESSPYCGPIQSAMNELPRTRKIVTTGSATIVRGQLFRPVVVHVRVETRNVPRYRAADAQVQQAHVPGERDKDGPDSIACITQVPHHVGREEEARNRRKDVASPG